MGNPRWVVAHLNGNIVWENILGTILFSPYIKGTVGILYAMGTVQPLPCVDARVAACASILIVSSERRVRPNTMWLHLERRSDGFSNVISHRDLRTRGLPLH